MEDKYKEFSDKFAALCDEFAHDDFDADGVMKVCKEVVDNYSN